MLLTVDSNYKSIQFIVEDSGKGFTKEEISFATEQFFQGDKSRNSKNHYGMGLYISKNLIEKHNGNIILQNSKTLGGAKVIIEVPI
ncbi:ATP-binding protein [Clostridium sp. K25]|uniref:ATP-binding protein n=1 Tax=Clostridium sp. K25 TaxID=1443109 RepID=UPI0009E4E51F